MHYLPLSVLLLPLLAAAPAHAADWPAGAKADFVRECLNGAKARYKEAAAQDYCACAADKVSAGLSESEMTQLHKQKQISPELQQRVARLSGACLSQLNQ